LEDNECNGGIVIGGRKVRLEMARNTLKLFIKLPKTENINLDSLKPISPKVKLIPIANDENAFFIKLNGSIDHQGFAQQLATNHPDWIIQIHTDQI
jgi:hypothetical protein